MLESNLMIVEGGERNIGVYWKAQKRKYSECEKLFLQNTGEYSFYSHQWMCWLRTSDNSSLVLVKRSWVLMVTSLCELQFHTSTIDNIILLILLLLKLEPALTFGFFTVYLNFEFPYMWGVMWVSNFGETIFRFLAARIRKCYSDPLLHPLFILFIWYHRLIRIYFILSDREVCQMIESSVPHSQLNPTSSSPGGPLLFTNVNGRMSTVTTPDNSNAMSMNSNADFPSYSLADDMYQSDFFPNYSHEAVDERQSWNDRPDSRHSMASVASPANPFSHPSPMTNPPSTPFPGPLPFSPVEKEMKDGQDSIVSDMKPCSDKGTSDRLRNLLLRSSSETEQDANHRSIEDYFGTQQDESMELGDTGPSPGQQRKSVTPTTPNSSSSGNHMLLSVIEFHYKLVTRSFRYLYFIF